MENELTCGIIMPISEIDGCSEVHWRELLSIYKECISDIGFTPNLVSDSNDSGIIQNRIIDNLYSNPIVICDISCRNANVMFELGLRLAFDKPTVILKDEMTPFSFDTSIIEHIIYPRDLNYSKIVEFKVKLMEKLKATYKKSKEDAEYSTFLRHFGQYKIAKLKESEITVDRFLRNSLDEINERLKLLMAKNISMPRMDNETETQISINDYVLVDFSEFTGDNEFVKIRIHPDFTFRTFLDNIFNKINKYVESFTYEFDWILINVETGEKILSKRSFDNIPRRIAFDDQRSLNELGIYNKQRLKVAKL